MSRWPEDTTSNLAREAKIWLLNYGITEDEIAKHRYLWSPSKKWLILPLFSGGDDGQGEIVAFQARNFSEHGPKYMTDGPIGHHSFVTGLAVNRPLVCLVEDAVSAIKVGRVVTTMALFGSHIGNYEIMHAKFLAPKCIIWLDKDKSKVSHDAAHRLSAYGYPTLSIVTDADPKALPMNVISEYINDAGELLNG